MTTSQLEEPVGESGSSEEDAIPSAKKLKTVDREASYVIVASPGGIFRLHRAGSYGCWMGRKRDCQTPYQSLYPRVQAMLAAQGGRRR